MINCCVLYMYLFGRFLKFMMFLAWVWWRFGHVWIGRVIEEVGTLFRRWGYCEPAILLCVRGNYIDRVGQVPREAGKKNMHNASRSLIGL